MTVVPNYMPKSTKAIRSGQTYGRTDSPNYRKASLLKMGNHGYYKRVSTLLKS